MTAPAAGARLLVTGGAGLHRLAASSATSWPGDDGTRITVLDKLTYAGNLANLAPSRRIPSRPPGSLRAGRHRRRGGRRTAGRRGRRGRQLRRRIPRGPLDPGPGRVPAHRRRRRPRAAGGGPHGDGPGGRRRARYGAALPPGLHRRGLRPVAGGSAARTTRSRPAAPTPPPRRRASCSRASYRDDLRAGRRDHPRRQHVRAVPAPGEAHPAVHHERARRPAAAALRRRHAAPRLAPRDRPRGRRRARPAPRRGGRGLQHPGRATSVPNREVVDPAAGAARQALVAGADRRRPAGPRPALRHGRRASSRRWAGRTGSPSRTGIAATVDWYREHEAWWRAVKARRLGRLLPSASTRAGWRGSAVAERER